MAKGSGGEKHNKPAAESAAEAKPKEVLVPPDLADADLLGDQAKDAVSSKLATEYGPVIQKLESTAKALVAFGKGIESSTQFDATAKAEIIRAVGKFSEKEFQKNLRALSLIKRNGGKGVVEYTLAARGIQGIIGELTKTVQAQEARAEQAKAQEGGKGKEGKGKKEALAKIDSLQAANVYFAANEQKLKDSYLVSYASTPPEEAPADASNEQKEKAQKRIDGFIKKMKWARFVVNKPKLLESVQEKIPTITLDEARTLVDADTIRKTKFPLHLVRAALDIKAAKLHTSKDDASLASTIAFNTFSESYFEKEPFIETADQAKKYIADHLDRLKKVYLVSESFKVPTEADLKDEQKANKLIRQARFLRSHLTSAEALAPTLPSHPERFVDYKQELFAYAKKHDKNPAFKDLSADKKPFEVIQMVETQRALDERKLTQDEARLYGSMMKTKFFREHPPKLEARMDYTKAVKFITDNIDAAKKNYLVSPYLTLESLTERKKEEVIHIAQAWKNEIPKAAGLWPNVPMISGPQADSMLLKMKRELPKDVVGNPENKVYYATLYKAQHDRAAGVTRPDLDDATIELQARINRNRFRYIQELKKGAITTHSYDEARDLLIRFYNAVNHEETVREKGVPLFDESRGIDAERYFVAIENKMKGVLEDCIDMIKAGAKSRVVMMSDIEGKTAWPGENQLSMDLFKFLVQQTGEYEILYQEGNTNFHFVRKGTALEETFGKKESETGAPDYVKTEWSNEHPEEVQTLLTLLAELSKEKNISIPNESDEDYRLRLERVVRGVPGYFDLVMDRDAEKFIEQNGGDTLDFSAIQNAIDEDNQRINQQIAAAASAAPSEEVAAVTAEEAAVEAVAEAPHESGNTIDEAPPAPEDEAATAASSEDDDEADEGAEVPEVPDDVEESAASEPTEATPEQVQAAVAETKRVEDKDRLRTWMYSDNGSTLISAMEDFAMGQDEDGKKYIQESVKKLSADDVALATEYTAHNIFKNDGKGPEQRQAFIEFISQLASNS